MFNRIAYHKFTDFRGFVFEREFEGKNLLNFEYKNIDFSEAIFRENANFSDMKITGNIKFDNVVFEKGVSFEDSVFEADCSFVGTEFSAKHMDDRIFQGVIFKGQDLIIKNANNFPRMEYLLLSDYSKIVFENVNYPKKYYDIGKINYRIARNQSMKIGDYERIGDYYYNEREYNSKLMKESDFANRNEYLGERFFDIMAKYTTGYGEKPWNILIINITIISLFAFFYLFMGIKSQDNQMVSINILNIGRYGFFDVLNRYFHLWYYSLVTFFTVGYGDMTSTTAIGKIFSCVEVFLGVTMGAIWTSIIMKRMLR
ncbi:MAG: potassium channel family protein [Clostridioides sp.]|jgi:hypothetical protein|nr:potassium channel family protein [Clostridioides sp.]